MVDLVESGRHFVECATGSGGLVNCGDVILVEFKCREVWLVFGLWYFLDCAAGGG